MSQFPPNQPPQQPYYQGQPPYPPQQPYLPPVKPKKPFYKRVWFVILAGLASIHRCGGLLSWRRNAEMPL